MGVQNSLIRKCVLLGCHRCRWWRVLLFCRVIWLRGRLVKTMLFWPFHNVAVIINIKLLSYLCFCFWLRVKSVKWVKMVLTFESVWCVGFLLARGGTFVFGGGGATGGLLSLMSLRAKSFCRVNFWSPVFSDLFYSFMEDWRWWRSFGLSMLSVAADTYNSFLMLLSIGFRVFGIFLS